MARLIGVLFLVLSPAFVESAKVRSLRYDQSLFGVAPSSRQELRALGKDGLQTRITALKEEVGQLEVEVEKSSEANAASIQKLQKQLNATTEKFPEKLPWRTEDERKLKANISKTEVLIAETHQQILAHGDVAERARSELEVLAKKGAKCKCEGASKAKKVSLLQTEGKSEPRHLSEDEIAAMVNDFTGLTADVATETTVVGGVPEDESVVIEGLVRKAEELQRRRADLQAQKQKAAKLFVEEQSKLLDQFQAASRKLSAAKIEAAREEELAKKRQRTLVDQQTYASAILTQQVAKLEKLNKQIAAFGARIKELSDLAKTCGCLAKETSVWMPPAKVSTTTTTTTPTATTTTVAPQVGLVRESAGDIDDAVDAEADAVHTTKSQALHSDTVIYNSWDVDMEHGKLQDANIKIYKAQATDLKVVRRRCGFSAVGSNASAKVYDMWCNPGYWGLSLDAVLDFGQGAVHDMVVLPPPGTEGKELLLLRFEIPRSGQYTLDLFGASLQGDGQADVFLFVNADERIALKQIASEELPTTTNGRNIVHDLGELAASDFLYFAVRGDHPVKIRFRIIGVAKAVTTTTTTSVSVIVQEKCNCQDICAKKVPGAVVPPTAACEDDACNSNCQGFGCGFMCAAEACASSCQGELCGYHCEGRGCAANCTGSSCGRRCKQTSCGQQCSGAGCSAECQGRNCGRSCEGYRCAYKCVGYQCAKGCVGVECGLGCEGEECASECVGENCDSECQGKDCASEKPLQLTATAGPIGCDCDCSRNVAVQGFAFVEGPKLSNQAQVQCDAEGAAMGSIEDIAHRCSREHCESLFDYNCDGIAWRNCQSPAGKLLQIATGDDSMGACSRVKQAGWLLVGIAQRGVLFVRPDLDSDLPVSAVRMNIDSISVRALDVTMKKVVGLTMSADDDDTFQQGQCVKLLPGGIVELPDGSKKEYSDRDVFTVSLGRAGFEFFQNGTPLASWPMQPLPGPLLAKLWLFDQHSSLEVLQACENIEGSYLSDDGPVIVSQRGCSITVTEKGVVKSAFVSGNSLMLAESLGHIKDGRILFENGRQWKVQS